jgi:hypothetical protein
VFLYIIYAIWLYRFINHFFEKYKFLSKPEVIKSDKYPAFTRSDYADWDKLNFFLCGLILYIPRIILCALSMIICTASVKIVLWFYGVKDFDAVIPPKCRILISKILSLTSKCILFFYAFMIVERKKIKLDKEDHPYFVKEPESNKAVLISNHTNSFDIFVHLVVSKYISYVSSKLVQTYPLFGVLATSAQCIFVDRNINNSRAKCLEDMRNRIKNLEKSPDSKWNQLF